MDYNDKLKLAKEALESGSYDRETIEYIFPELAESKDEKIREEIIAYMRYERKSTEEEIENRFIPWLEKQCKQKTNEIHPIFRVGDYIRNKKTCDKVLIEQLDVKSKAYCYTSYDGGAEIHSDFPFSKQDEWELIGQKSVEQKPAWSEEDEKGLGDALWAIEQARTIAKDENDMGNLWYAENWLKSLKERMEEDCEQKITWSEDDEKIIDEAISLISMLASGYGEKVTEPITFNGVKMINNVKEKLRNLHKKLNHWKPSDEQMNFLWKYAEQNNYDGRVLTSLFRDLKKLREE